MSAEESGRIHRHRQAHRYLNPHDARSHVAAEGIEDYRVPLEIGDIVALGFVIAVANTCLKALKEARDVE